MLGWNKLIKQYIEIRRNRKKYKISWKPEFVVDDQTFEIVLIPTISYTPWFHVQPGWGRIIIISWLNFSIVMGKLERKEEYND